MEIWKGINGIMPYYQVSNLGRIKSCERVTNCNGGVFQRKEKILKQFKNRLGYLNVYLYDVNDNRKTFLVHRLVAEAFHINDKGFKKVDHIDGVRDNNNANNLRWVTHKQNCRNANTLEKYKKRVGELANHKRGIKAYKLDGTFVGEWFSITIASKETGTNRHSISYAANGKYKTANNLIWKYNDKS